MSVTTQSGHLYFMTFIDDYSQKTWIYFLKSKESDEVLDRFREFRALVENQSGKKSRFFGQIMVVSILSVGSLISSMRQGSRGSLQFLITHNIME